MIGGIQSIAAGLVNTGAASWLVNTVMSDAATWSGMVTNVIASALTSILHVIIPTGPAVVGLALVAMVEVAGIASLSAASFALITAFWSNVTYLLPIDTVPLITFGKGYYKMSDMIKAGIVPNIIMILAAALLIPALANLLGY
jgi:sodium-dependent dicarboxylate transporter 2/3/5